MLHYQQCGFRLGAQRRPTVVVRRGGKLACRAAETSSLPGVSPSNFRKLAARAPLFSLPSEDEIEDEGDCSVYVDRTGNFIKVMCWDYGYRAGAGRMYSDASGTIPVSGIQMAVENFKLEFACLRRSFREDEYAQFTQPSQSVAGKVWRSLGRVAVAVFGGLDRALESVGLLPKLSSSIDDLMRREGRANARMEDGNDLKGESKEIRDKLSALVLSNAAVWEREHTRESAGAGVPTPWYVKGVYLALCVMLDVLFESRPIQRFLETVARMPYFSYISCLHLYESLGWWRAAAELRKVHFAEEWNELHHLQIMESLGGDRMWADRFFGYHAAVVYYFILVGFFIASPSLAYNFSELIEAHAVDTYGEFVDANEELLKSLPPPLVAAEYYRSQDLYMFDEFQTATVEPRDPQCNNLYDVFCNIRDDEGEHVKTMKACQDASVVKELAQRKEQPRRV